MKKLSLKSVIILALFTGGILFSNSTFAQNEPDKNETSKFELYIIRTNDGNTFQGKKISENSELIELETKTVRILKIQKSEIKKISIIEAVEKESGIWPRNRQSARYYFAPNGYGLKKGEAFW